MANPLISRLNDNPKKQGWSVASLVVIIGDILRIVSIILLAVFAYNKKFNYFRNFLLTYAISSVLIGYFAYTHGHNARGLSEWIVALIVFVLYSRD